MSVRRRLPAERDETERPIFIAGSSVRSYYRWDAVAESYMRLDEGLPADYLPARKDF